MTMSEIEQSIISDLTELDDILAKSEFLMRCGKLYAGIPKEERRKEDIIKDCQMLTWLRAEYDEAGRLVIHADSESLLVKGALAMIDEIYSGRTKEEVKEFNCSLLDEECFAALFNATQKKGIREMLEKLR